MAEEVASPLLALLQDPQRAPLIKQGAEAKVYRVELYTISSSITLPDAVSTKQEDYAYPILLKHRFFKKYRHPMLSASITATRTVSEARSLVRCARSGVHVPRLELVDETRGIIGMEWIHGVSVRRLLGGIPEESDCEDITLLSTTPALTEERAQEVMDKIGVQLAEMHCADVIHGDLTTSNMMLRDLDTSIVLIDFGLASVSTFWEDKAVDLYVLERAFISTHPESHTLFLRILDTYAARTTQITKRKGHEQGAWPHIRSKLEEVRLRGRKRSMVG